MTASNKAFEFITQEEGIVLHTYLDSAGIPTIGIGSTQYKDGTKPKLGDTITLQQAQDLLAWEVSNKTSHLTSLLGGYVVNQNQYDALTSLIYNIGIGAFEKSTVLKLIKKNPCDPDIKDAWLAWCKITVGGKKVLSKGLLARRKREYELYNSNTV